MLGFLLGISLFLNVFLLLGYKILLDKVKELRKVVDKFDDEYKNKFKEAIKNL